MADRDALEAVNGWDLWDSWDLWGGLISPISRIGPIGSRGPWALQTPATAVDHYASPSSYRGTLGANSCENACSSHGLAS